MTRNRNVLIWAGVIAVVVGLWLFAARIRLHLVDPMAFIGYVAVAALCLTALFWWGLAGGEQEKNGPEAQEEKR